MHWVETISKSADPSWDQDSGILPDEEYEALRIYIYICIYIYIERERDKEYTRRASPLMCLFIWNMESGIRDGPTATVYVGMLL